MGVVLFKKHGIKKKKHGIKKLREKLWFKDRRGRTNGVSKTKRNSALEIPWFVKTT